MLNDAAVRAARPRAAAYKIADERGLHLFVAPNGRRSFRLKFRYQGREQLLTIGTWPEISLADARARRDVAREQLARGEDPRPAQVCEIVQIRNFEDAARAWHRHQLARWTAVHAADVLQSLERDIFPVIGAMPMAAITPPVVLAVIRTVEARGSIETARRLRQRISTVFAFAVSEGWAQHDPAAIVAKALQPPALKRQQPALIEIDAARELLAAAELVDAAPATKLASTFLALTAVRLAAVRGASWSEFEGVDWSGDLVGPTQPIWRVPAERMKLAAAKKSSSSNDHLVPLVPAAVQLLRAARALAGNDQIEGGLVFAGRFGNNPIGEAAIGALYDRAGFRGRHVPHGWRATFSTVLNERFPNDNSAIDRALAHAAKDKVEAAYNRARHLARRRFLYQRWADLLLRPI
jgi:integrase